MYVHSGAVVREGRGETCVVGSRVCGGNIKVGGRDAQNVTEDGTAIQANDCTRCISGIVKGSQIGCLSEEVMSGTNRGGDDGECLQHLWRGRVWI